MRCQCNKIRLNAGIVGEWVRTIGPSARERWGASLCMPPSGIPVLRTRSPCCVADVQHLMGERSQIELTLYRGDFGSQPLRFHAPETDKRRAARCNWSCVFITIGDGFPKRFS